MTTEPRMIPATMMVPESDVRIALARPAPAAVLTATRPKLARNIFQNSDSPSSGWALGRASRLAPRDVAAEDLSAWVWLIPPWVSNLYACEMDHLGAGRVPTSVSSRSD